MRVMSPLQKINKILEISDLYIIFNYMKYMGLIILIAVLYSTAINAIGITASPATILLYDVPVGEKFDISSNRGYIISVGGVGYSTWFKLTPRKPSEDNTFATGYFDFENPEWFHIEHESVFVEKDATEKARIWVEFPENPSLYNRHFLLGIDVVPLTIKGMMGVGAYLLFRFETQENSTAIPKLPHGEFAFVPSKVEFNDVSPGYKKKVRVKLFHGDSTSQTYNLYRLDPSSPVATVTILPYPGFRRVGDEFVKYPKNVNVDVNGGEIEIEVDMKKNLPYPRIEEILIAENKDGKKAFLRILLFAK